MYYIINLSICEHRCSPNTPLKDNKEYDSDGNELEDDDESYEFNDTDTNYTPQYKKRKQQKNSKYKIKFMNEILGYGQNNYVYKALCNDKTCATKFCDTIKNTEMMKQIKNEEKLYNHLKSLQDIYIPNKIA